MCTLNCTLLYTVVDHCTLLYSVTLCCTLLYSVMHYCILLYHCCTVLYSVVHCCTTLFIVSDCFTLYSGVQQETRYNGVYSLHQCTCELANIRFVTKYSSVCADFVWKFIRIGNKFLIVINAHCFFNLWIFTWST